MSTVARGRAWIATASPPADGVGDARLIKGHDQGAELVQEVEHGASIEPGRRTGKAHGFGNLLLLHLL